MCVIGAPGSSPAFENTGTANFRRETNFSAEFRWMASKRLVSFVATLVAAFTLRSYWALVMPFSPAAIKW